MRETSSAISRTVSIERLRMTHDSFHEPVLVDEVIELFANVSSGVIIDATLGGGGHAERLLEDARFRVLGIDRDLEARSVAHERLARFGERVRIVGANFSDVSSVVHHNTDFLHADDVVGVLMDLGVSSHQLDQSSRGFSFRFDAPLDMRMDPTTGETAHEFLARVTIHELAGLLRKNGETRFASSIAKSIIEHRPLTTFELNAAVERAVPPAARRRGHVATRTFQALRIAVNAEEEELEHGLANALDVLAVGGVMSVIAYHSGEDRMVKAFLADQQSGGCRCPKELGCVCGALRRVEVHKASARLASSSEVARNPRARSARLRSARKIAP